MKPGGLVFQQHDIDPGLKIKIGIVSGERINGQGFASQQIDSFCNTVDSKNWVEKSQLRLKRIDQDQKVSTINKQKLTKKSPDSWMSMFSVKIFNKYNEKVCWLTFRWVYSILNFPLVPKAKCLQFVSFRSWLLSKNVNRRCLAKTEHKKRTTMCDFGTWNVCGENSDRLFSTFYIFTIFFADWTKNLKAITETRNFTEVT